jgi:hypothetical protein
MSQTTQPVLRVNATNEQMASFLEAVIEGYEFRNRKTQTTIMNRPPAPQNQTTENKAGSNSAPFDHPEQVPSQTNQQETNKPKSTKEQIDVEYDKFLEIYALGYDPVPF